MTWRYALIKVHEDEDDPRDISCELGEVYESERGRAFCLCSPHNLESLRRALKDVEQFGVDETWFNTGTFELEWVDNQSFWKWTPGPNAPKSPFEWNNKEKE